jgi:hypothetical protein
VSAVFDWPLAIAVSTGLGATVRAATPGEAALDGVPGREIEDPLSAVPAPGRLMPVVELGEFDPGAVNCGRLIPLSRLPLSGVPGRLMPPVVDGVLAAGGANLLLLSDDDDGRDTDGAGAGADGREIDPDDDDEDLSPVAASVACEPLLPLLCDEEL